MVKKTKKNKDEGKTYIPVSQKDLNEGEEVCETFEVEEKGKTEIIKTCGNEERGEHADKKQIENQNKILRNFLLILGVLIIAFVGGYFMIESSKSFEYRDVNFEIIKEGELIFYKTGFPLNKEFGDITHNFYIEMIRET